MVGLGSDVGASLAVAPISDFFTLTDTAIDNHDSALTSSRQFIATTMMSKNS
jgi:hypothetical protein